MRRAFHEEGEPFHAWLMSMADGEPEEQGMAIDPTAMQAEMPEIPVAGSGEATQQAPDGPDAQQDDDQ